MSELLLYDGTFNGYLTAIFELYDRKCAAPIIEKNNGQTALFYPVAHTIVTDIKKAQRVWTGIEKKAGKSTCLKVYKTFLSELNKLENPLTAYLQYLFKHHDNRKNDYSNAEVLWVEQTARKVSREKHRMEAFVRFENVGNGLYYAAIEPDYNVLPLILPHFKNRYAAQNWIIYDTKRRYGIQYDSQSEKANEITIDFIQHQSTTSIAEIVFDPDEKLYQELWKQYFKSTNIEQRKNTKLHLKHLPKRYWRYLTEKMEDMQ